MSVLNKKPRSIFLLSEDLHKRIYNSDALEKVCQMTSNDGIVYIADSILQNRRAFYDVEIIFSGWGAPVMDEQILSCFPSLKAFFYAAGSVRYFVTDAFWSRQIILTSGYKANAIPVADFTIASVIFGLKAAWTRCAELKKGILPKNFEPSGVYRGSKVGVISLGAIGQLVCERLRNLELDVYAYDPYANDALFENLKVNRIEKLETLFSSCDVVTLHTPWLPETENLITERMLASMPKGSVFINTSRGAIVEEAGLLKVLKARPDIFAVLDVLQDESTYHSNPLTTLSNVFITPHIAGAQGRECQRMGSLAVEECRRFLDREAQITPITRELAERLA